MAELLRLKAEVNTRDNAGRTPLMRACEEGHASVIRTLRSEGHAFLHLHDDRSETAFVKACSNGRAGAITVLHELGASLVVKVNNGVVPLCWRAGRDTSQPSRPCTH